MERRWDFCDSFWQSAVFYSKILHGSLRASERLLKVCSSRVPRLVSAELFIGERELGVMGGKTSITSDRLIRLVVSCNHRPGYTLNSNHHAIA